MKEKCALFRRKHKKEGTDIPSLTLPKKLNAKTKSKQKTQIMIILFLYLIDVPFYSYSALS